MRFEQLAQRLGKSFINGHSLPSSHRQQGQLTGYRGGLAMKQALLTFEQS